MKQFCYSCSSFFILFPIILSTPEIDTEMGIGMKIQMALSLSSGVPGIE
jgi:hypothetical protein